MLILISGSLAYDRIMNFPGRFEDHILPEKLHILNVSFEVGGLTEQFGGTAGNIAYNLALLGEAPRVLASAGRDFDRYAAWMAEHGLSMDGIRLVDDEFTAGAYITTDLSDNQITGFNPGAMRHPSTHDLAGIEPADTLAIVSPGNTEDMAAYPRAYKKLAIPYIFDPGQQIPVLPHGHLKEILDGSEILISNDYELEMIRKATGYDHDRILRHTRAIITTLGEKGSVVRTRETEAEIPSAAADAVMDPTGAGDAYRAGLIKGLTMGKNLDEAARMGATCASFAVQVSGTQVHRFTQAEFWERHTANFGG